MFQADRLRDASSRAAAPTHDLQRPARHHVTAERIVRTERDPITSVILELHRTTDTSAARNDGVIECGAKSESFDGHGRDRSTRSWGRRQVRERVGKVAYAQDDGVAVALPE